VTNTAIERLTAVLASEESLYRELLALLQRERDLMVDLDADGLAEVTWQKDTLATEGRLIEQGRVEAANRLAEALDISSRPATLSEICERLGDDAGAMRATHTRLVALVGAVRELVEANRAMGGDRLAFVQSTLGLLGRMLPGRTPEPRPYERSGVVPDETMPGGHLVRRSA
jgi:hypothetical protein